VRLKLDGAKPNLHDDNLVLVQNWLQLTGRLFYLGTLGNCLSRKGPLLWFKADQPGRRMQMANCL
jgi:hypothetical protein